MSHAHPHHGTPLPFSEHEIAIRQRMHERVLSLSFPAYCQVIRKLLHRSGYSSIQSLGTGAKRKTTGRGGLDLLAIGHTDIATTLTAIQVKRYQGLVPRRFVHELRGVMVGRAEKGMMIATSRFSPTARRAAEESQLLPIELVDGEKLVEMLIERRIGLRHCKGGKANAWEFDARYFDQLEERAIASLEAERAGRNRKLSSGSVLLERRGL